MTQQTVAGGLSKRVGDVAEPDFISLPEDMLVGVAVKVMRDRDVSSILVSKVKDKSKWSSNYSSDQYDSSIPTFRPILSKDNIVGILTERDILYRVMAENRGPYKVTLGQIMSSPLVTISENASVRDAIALMQSKQIRRLPVLKEDGSVIGLVTLKTVIGNMPSHNIDLAEIDPLRAIAERESVCPYCRSVLKENDTMVGHMGSTHMQRK